MKPSPRTRLILISKAGNLCSFPDCTNELVANTSQVDGAELLVEFAHITGQSPEGPRGMDSRDDSRIDEYENLIALCPTHHTQIDKQRKTYTVVKLQQMKSEHEQWVRDTLSKTSRFQGMHQPQALTKDSLTSTFLPVRRMPASVYGAPCKLKEADVKKLIDFSAAKGAAVPFIVREKTLYSFVDLTQVDGPFRNAIDPNRAAPLRATEWWSDPDRLRWYMELLNRSLNKLTGRLGLRLDKEHKRYYFEPTGDPEVPPTSDAEVEARFRTVSYRSLGGPRSTKQVAWRPVFRKTGMPKSYWEHLAVGLRFHYMGGLSWILSIRPERRFTRDGYTPLTPKGTGKRSTNRKSHMYNGNVQMEVHFWKEFLSTEQSDGRSQPRIVLSFGNQRLIVESETTVFNVEWPGVPDDAKAINYVREGDDLFSSALLAGEDEDGAEEPDAWGTDADWN